MSKLDLRYYPDPILKLEARQVDSITKEIKTLISDMINTMYDENGIGLAAPQVGQNLAITVIDVTEEQDSPIVLINPKVIKKTELIDSEEGCLSLPGYRETIKRFEKVDVKYLDENFTEQIITEAEGMLSRCLQHEIDHLNGILFTDYLKGLKKQLFIKWAKKNLPPEDAND